MRPFEQPGARAVTWRAKFFAVLASTTLSLAVAERVLARAQHDAYAFLNVFEINARYGVTLIPGARTRLRSRAGRLTDVHINPQGFRGPAWTPATAERPVSRRVMILGDSQVFGYNVAWDDTMASHLARAMGHAEVLAAAVPTWGPTEYVRAVDELAPIYRPEVVVFVANAANDWFEISVENARRTTARDGWSERLTLPYEAPRWFPGRAFLMGRSHLVLAARQVFAHVANEELPPAEMALRILHELPQIGAPRGADRSRMTLHLRAIEDQCRALGCRVIAAALPLDVQVHTGEWAKYRTTPIDLRATERLLSDFVDDARRYEIPAVNLIDALRAASPGAFLSDDYHLSPAGHRLVAHCLANVLTHEARP